MIVEFDIDEKKKTVKCLRCDKDLSQAVKILGGIQTCLGFHIYAHLLEDLGGFPEHLTVNLANMLVCFGKDISK